MKRDLWLYFIAVIGGAAIWIAVAQNTGRREAWDSGVYFSVGIPAVCLLAVALAFVEPLRPWRWGVLPMLGQLLWLLVSEGPGNLLPLGIVLFAVLSVPSVVAAWIAATIALKRTGRDEP